MDDAEFIPMDRVVNNNQPPQSNNENEPANHVEVDTHLVAEVAPTHTSEPHLLDCSNTSSLPIVSYVIETCIIVVICLYIYFLSSYV